MNENETATGTPAPKPARNVDFDIPLKFTGTLKLTQIPVELDNPINPEKPLNYTLKELRGLERDEFLNFGITKQRISADGKQAGMRDMKNVHARLIHMSLYDENNVRVPEETIQGWPGSLQKQLFSLCQKISGLDGDAEEREGNS